jgi:hypothetical protein
VVWANVIVAVLAVLAVLAVCGAILHSSTINHDTAMGLQ